MKIKMLFKKIFEYLVLFVFGGLVYIGLELIYDGSTHWTMFFCGGIALILIGIMNEDLPWEMPIWLQCLYGSILITALELGVGLLFNRDYSLWDYRNIPLNFMGQICLVYSALWFVLSGVAIVLDDYIRYFVLKEDKPRYYLK